MTQGSESGTTTFADDADEDTIELELTPEQVLALSHGAQPTQAPRVESAPPAARPVPPATKPRTQSGGTTRFRFWPVTLAVAAIAVTGAVTWRTAAQRAADPPPTPLVLAPDPPPLAAAPLPPPEPEGPPVRVQNPFDAAEVFEFPAGTSAGDAREAVSELLLQRASERRSAPSATHSGNRRSARRGAGERSGVLGPETNRPN